MAIAQHLLDILRCPKSLGELIYVTGEEQEFLFCPDSKLRYRVEDGIPVMLVDEAELLDEAACEAIVSKNAKN
ncbi:MAG: Trm112 family protein [Myxococcales bacterium]|nr:Trm112 family protein [Myxococcales bacterium]